MGDGGAMFFVCFLLSEKLCIITTTVLQTCNYRPVECASITHNPDNKTVAAHTRYVYPAHIQRGMMVLGQSAHVSQDRPK